MSKITLVDDDVEFCEATQILLESMGYEVTVAYDGKQGLKKIRQAKPDLVILDVMMPEMNGYDVFGISCFEKDSYHSFDRC